jgi:predicted permease
MFTIFSETVRDDARIGIRLLAKNKVFTCLAVGILSLGMCGVLTQFAVIDAILLRGLPFSEPRTLVSLGFIDPTASFAQNNDGRGVIPSLQDFHDLKAAQQSFLGIAGYVGDATISLSRNNNPIRYTGAYVTEDLFRILGVKPILGRDFTSSDNTFGAPKTALLGYETWLRDFAGDPNIAGQPVFINGRAATIIGVMPPNFRFPVAEQIWVPYENEFPLRTRGEPGAFNIEVIGRLNPGVTRNQANVELKELATRIARDNPKTNQHLASATTEPLLNAFVGPAVRKASYAMFGAVVIVLLIACVNVMNMQFARGVARAPEFGVRAALGATPSRLARQMLVENFLIAGAAAVIGTALTYGAMRALRVAAQTLRDPLPYWVVFRIHGYELSFVVVLILFATLLAGLAPALVMSRIDPAAIMKETGRGHSSRIFQRVTRLLVIGQIGLATTVLIATILQVESIRNQMRIDYGYDETAAYCARVGLFEGAYPTAESRQAFYLRCLQSLRNNPAFADAALTTRARMTFASTGRYEVEGQTYMAENDRPRGNYEFVSDRYFATLGLRITEGRDFTFEDSDARQPVAICNASFRRKYFGGESPIGRRLRIFNPAHPQPWRTIIGVVPDTLMQGPVDQQSDSSGFYAPLLGVAHTPQFATILVRSHAAERADALARPLALAVSQLDGNLPIYFGGTPRQLHRELIGLNRNIAFLFTIFGTVAIVLACVGLYAVASFSVNERIHEFAIRVALGASTRKVIGIVMLQAARQLAIGLSLGFATSLTLAKVIGSSTMHDLLFRADPLNPNVYVAAGALLTIVAATTCFVPARRVSRLDPAVILREA